MQNNRAWAPRPGAHAIRSTTCLRRQDPSETPHRFIFIRKSNGNIPSLFSLPTFSDEQKKQEQKKEAFEVDLDKHELPQWLRALDGHKENMTILHGISMTVSGGGHYSFSGCMGAYKAGRNTISGIKRTTVDFELAKLFPSPFGHVELSLARGRERSPSGPASSPASPHRRSSSETTATPTLRPLTTNCSSR